MLVYLYDENGAPIGMRYRTPAMAANTFQNFFFEKNLQGDIVGIWNQSGTKVITYTYDAWGRVVPVGCFFVRPLDEIVFLRYNGVKRTNVL